MAEQDRGFEDIFFTTRDGLKLHARCYPAVARGGRPLVCLPGLTRNGRDFHDIALALSRHPSSPRTVYTLDYRGRGLSEFDRNWKNYAVPIETQDVVDLMIRSEIYGAGIIGTSRGGLIAMVLAAAQQTAVGPVVLNDIGPVVEAAGLARISGYVGRTPTPSDWAVATRQVRDLNRHQFPAVSDAQWEEVARAWYNEKNGRPVPGYDRKLCRALSVLDGPIPELWPQFEALRRVPVMVLRGEHSDILSPATVDKMARRHPALEAVTVPGQGHAPLLKDAPTIEAIARFLAAAEASGPH